ncbi:MAG: response regulator [Oscillospiraceae bacterium]
MRIAICDDDPRELERLAQVLREYAAQRDVPSDFCSFSNGIDFLSGMKGGEYDAVLLDVCMPGFSGIQTARELRELDKNVKILFLTISPEFAVESYSVNAYHYLIKPASPQTLFPLLDNINSEIHAQAEEGLLLRGRDGVLQIPFSRLEYVEVMNKTVSFHLTDASVRELSAALADFEEALLLRPEFLKVHRSFLLNLRHVQSVGAKGAVTRTGHTIPISRALYAHVKETYLRFLFQPPAEAAPAPAPPGAPPKARPDSPWRILLVDDDQRERDLWAERLRCHGCVVDTAPNGGEALRLAATYPCDCILLDVMLAGEESFGFCSQLRAISTAPVIFLSCLTDAEVQLRGFSVGGTDYITKDTPAELFWRKIEARLDRAGRTQLRFGPLLLELSQRRATVEERELILTPTEFDLLWLLSANSPRVYTPEELYRTVWGAQQWDGGQTVQVHMSRLRRKLEAAYPRHYFIETVWGEGYRFVPTERETGGSPR